MVEFLFIQTAQSGSTSENNATSYLLELNKISNETVLFSERPDRFVESISTSDFIGNWTIGQDSFAIDPPNAVLVYEDIHTGKLDTVIVELFNPVYDKATNTLIYTVVFENTAESNLPIKFNQAIIVIDACDPGTSICKPL